MHFRNNLITNSNFKPFCRNGPINKFLKITICHIFFCYWVLEQECRRICWFFNIKFKLSGSPLCGVWRGVKINITRSGRFWIIFILPVTLFVNAYCVYIFIVCYVYCKCFIGSSSHKVVNLITRYCQCYGRSACAVYVYIKLCGIIV